MLQMLPGSNKDIICNNLLQASQSLGFGPWNDCTLKVYRVQTADAGGIGMFCKRAAGGKRSLTRICVCAFTVSPRWAEAVLAALSPVCGFELHGLFLSFYAGRLPLCQVFQQ